ncbi:Prophage CP4-57 regulatory protein (AlpA) [compost metagenome]
MTESRKLLTLKQVCALVERSRQTIHAWYTAGKFPKPILQDPEDARSCRWVESEVNAWIEERMAARTA